MAPQADYLILKRRAQEQERMKAMFGELMKEQMAPMLTVSADEGGGWTAISTDLGKEKFNLADASLTNVESVRIFIGFGT